MESAPFIKLHTDINPLPKARMTRRSKWSKRAGRTLKYQESLAWLMRQQNFGVKQTRQPLSLSATFGVKSRQPSDLKNLIAALEDALQYSGLIENDRQIIEYNRCQVINEVKKPFLKMEVREIA